MAASQASGGISDDVIHAMALARLRDHGAQEAVLDFGAGMGQFAQRLAQSGLYRTVAAADLMARPDSLPSQVAWHQADLNERLPLADASFDVIAAIEVIEHLENPRAMLRECLRLLRPGGLLVLTTPNNESLRSLLSLALRGYFAAFGPHSYPAHITPLLRIDLSRAATEAGFVDQGFRFSGQGVVPRFVSLRWQTLSLGCLRGRLFSDNLLFACSKVA
ncbi:MAG: class I SAM-dependent methyltransferase [Reyranellaceae bacterium]